MNNDQPHAVPTDNERGYAKLALLVMDEAPTRADAVDFLARILATHRERVTHEIVQSMSRGGL